MTTPCNKTKKNLGSEQYRSDGETNAVDNEVRPCTIRLLEDQKPD